MFYFLMLSFHDVNAKNVTLPVDETNDSFQKQLAKRILRYWQSHSGTKVRNDQDKK